MPRVRRPPLAAGLLPVLLVALVVLGAAAAGPWRSSLRVPNGPRWQVVLRPPAPAATPPQRPHTPLPSPHQNWVLFALVVLFLLVVLALVVALAIAVLVTTVRWLREHWRLPEARRSAEELPEFTGIPLAAARVAEAVERAEREAATAADPKDGVVRAWVALEDAAALSGVARDPASTPTEFVVDVLDRTGADPAATRGLLAVYEHARFGSDAVGDEEVAFARECLAELRHGIQVSLA